MQPSFYFGAKQLDGLHRKQLTLGNEQSTTSVFRGLGAAGWPLLHHHAVPSGYATGTQIIEVLQDTPSVELSTPVLPR